MIGLLGIFTRKWYAKITQSHSHWFQNLVSSTSTSMELKILTNNIIPFSMRYIKLYLVRKKSLPENPKPDKITLSSTIAFTGWLHFRTHIIKVFGEYKDVEYASIHHLFDKLLPLNFLHYPVIVRSGNFNNIQDSMKRLRLVFITMDRHHYNQATLSWTVTHSTIKTHVLNITKLNKICVQFLPKKSRNLSLKYQKLYKQDR